MSIENRKAISRRFYEEIFSQGKLDVADEICAADYVNEDPYGPPGGWPGGPAGVKALVNTYRTAFSNLVFTVEDQVADSDHVATRWSARGTHTGPLPGGIEPTGKSAVVTGISIERYAHDKIMKSRVSWDFMGMLQQLGVIPTPGA